VAYEAMGDLDGAIEILDEVIATRKAPLVAEAERLKAKWQNG
jgi:FimV-like protein